MARAGRQRQGTGTELRTHWKADRKEKPTRGVCAERQDALLRIFVAAVVPSPGTFGLPTLVSADANVWRGSATLPTPDGTPTSTHTGPVQSPRLALVSSEDKSMEKEVGTLEGC